MSMQDYEEALRLIEEAGDSDFGGAQPESLVAKAETALGVRFPQSYRRFLLELGAGGFNGFEIYGLTTDNFTNASVPNGIWLTLTYRTQFNLESKYVVIGSVGNGTDYAIDTSKMNDEGESPVVLLSVDGKEFETVAESFGTFFLEEIKAVI